MVRHNRNTRARLAALTEQMRADATNGHVAGTLRQLRDRYQYPGGITTLWRDLNILADDGTITWRRITGNPNSTITLTEA